MTVCREYSNLILWAGQRHLLMLTLSPTVTTELQVSLGEQLNAPLVDLTCDL